MKYAATLLIALLSLWGLSAQEPDSVCADRGLPRIALSLEARGDYQRVYKADGLQAGDTGFKGNIANVALRGAFTPKLSYSYRQRLNGINLDRSFFDSVDFLYLQYDPIRQLSLKLGKWIVFVGGWEFEPAPIDVFQLGEFCYQMPAYQWGVTLSYALPKGQDRLHAQIIQSPFRRMYETAHAAPADMYAYNLVWTGRHGLYEPTWSVNFMEYAPKSYISYISLGNRFHLGEKAFIDLEVMNRSALRGQRRFFFSDYSLFGQAAYYPTPQLKLYLKGSYDQNTSGTDADLCVADGTRIACVGGGIEYSPTEQVRLHAHGNYAFGHNPNPAAVLTDTRTLLNVGITWRINILSK